MTADEVATTIEDVFAEFGRAAHHAQLIEYSLVSLWMLDSVTQGISVTLSDLLGFQQDWSKRTMGQLLRPLRKSDLVPPDLAEFLEKLRIGRNFLMHSFFVDEAIDLQTYHGRQKAVAEL